MKKIIPLPNLTTFDGEQQYLTSRDDLYYAECRDRSQVQIFDEKSFANVPDAYKKFARDAEKEYKVKISSNCYLVNYSLGNNRTNPVQMKTTDVESLATIYTESEIEHMRDDPNINIDFEHALLRVDI